MNDKTKLLVVSAHAADFVWRSGGTIAKYIENGAEVNLIVLSFGARGESNDLWKIPDQTTEGVKKIRKAEVQEAASSLGVEKLEMWDFDDYFMDINSERLYRLVRRIREIGPHHIISHSVKDLFNPDHEAVAQYVFKATTLAISHAAGVKIEGTTPIPQPQIFGFEHHQTEISDYKPEVFIDITDTYHLKEKAMNCFKTQKHLIEYYASRAMQRGNHARRISGNKEIQHAETFSRYFPYVGDKLV